MQATTAAFLHQRHPVPIATDTPLDDLWAISERLSIGALRDWQAVCGEIALATLSREWDLGGILLGCHVRAADVKPVPNRFVMTWTINGTAVRRRRAIELIAERNEAINRRKLAAQATPTA